MTYLICDSSFEGFLTAIFEIFERRLNSYRIRRQGDTIPELFIQQLDIYTDSSKARRVWTGIEKITSKSLAHDCWKLWITEVPENEDILTACLCYLFKIKKNIFKDLSHPDVLKFNQSLKIIGRERHRMEAFVRFERTADDLYYSLIEPDFNVLPLLDSHFKDRYTDQQWLIYDTKRKYGIYYDLKSVETVEMDIPSTSEQMEIHSENELNYQDLWATYFSSTNIRERKNIRLHLRHVPKRYWKFLTEKRFS